MNTKITLIADGRSPTSRSWIAHLQQLDYEISLVSSYPFDPIPGIQESIVLPLALSQFNNGGVAQSISGGRPSQASRIKKWLGPLLPIYRWFRMLIGPMSTRYFAKDYRAFLAKVQPDLVHALRIPYEGMLGSFTPQGIPFLVATWGNDLTLHAKRSPWMRAATRRCLNRADGLTSDTLRDIRLAHEWGLRSDVPTQAVPGSGGLDLATIDQISPEDFDPTDLHLNPDVPWVVNPRGIRPGSIHQEAFFEAIPKVLAQAPEALFVCPALAGVRQAEEWIRQWDIAPSVVLLPQLSQPQLFALFKRSQIFVSPTSHDGTPNSLLEAMACGCYPVVGRIESIEEWVTSGENGTLVPPRDPDAIAAAILEALKAPEKRQAAAEVNRAILKSRAANEATLPLIRDFYSQFL
jgi:glycosyltransferase involved in cell wall biosynthesis